MKIREILKELLKKLHNPEYSEEDKYRIVVAYNELMRVFEHNER